MKTSDWAWAAGFIDGEGCLYWCKGSSPALSAAQVNREPLERLQQIFGAGAIYGKKRDNPNHRRCWQFYIGGKKNLIPVLKKLYPHLTVKRSAAKEMLDWHIEVKKARRLKWFLARTRI